MSDAGDPPRVALIAALGIAIATVAAVLAIATAGQHRRQPISVAAVPAPHAADSVCTTLLDALPQHLGDHPRVELARPEAGVAAWSAGGDEPLVLRCGLDRPADFVVGSPIQGINQVQWFQARAGDRSTWFTVDRPVYVALTLPAGSGPAPIQQLSDLVARIVPAAPINPAAPDQP